MTKEEVRCFNATTRWDRLGLLQRRCEELTVVTRRKVWVQRNGGTPGEDLYLVLVGEPTGEKVALGSSLLYSQACELLDSLAA